MWKRIVFCLLIGSLQLSGHSSNNENLAERVSVLQQTTNEDFHAFEKKFVSDAKFQMSRIIFDNLGYKYDEEPESKGVKYTPDNWTTLKNTLDDVRKMGQFKTKRELTADKCVQKIWIQDSSFILEYTYTKIKGKWYLTKVFESY